MGVLPMPASPRLTVFCEIELTKLRSRLHFEVFWRHSKNEKTRNVVKSLSLVGLSLVIL